MHDMVNAIDDIKEKITSQEYVALMVLCKREYDAANANLPPPVPTAQIVPRAPRVRRWECAPMMISKDAHCLLRIFMFFPQVLLTDERTPLPLLGVQIALVALIVCGVFSVLASKTKTILVLLVVETALQAAQVTLFFVVYEKCTSNSLGMLIAVMVMYPLSCYTAMLVAART
jgi:hypothetical protein